MICGWQLRSVTGWQLCAMARLSKMAPQQRFLTPLNTAIPAIFSPPFQAKIGNVR